MAIKIIEICTCDVCKKEREVEEIKMHIVFKNSRNYPTIGAKKIDICEDCLEKIYEGRQLMCDGNYECDNYFFKTFKDF
jgi:hypothetical protein